MSIITNRTSNMDNGAETATIGKEGSEKYLSVSIISKELEETISRTEEITQKIKTQSDEIAKMKETLFDIDRSQAGL